MKIVPLATPAAPAAIGPYAQGVSCGELVFCSGQIGLDPTTGELIAGGIEAETRRALANLAAVLDCADASFASLLRVSIYLVDLGDFTRVNAIYAEALGEARPARSTIGVAALPRGARIEIDAIATRPAPA